MGGRKNFLPLVILLFTFILFVHQPLLSAKPGFSLSGRLGWGYYGRNPFLPQLTNWHYGQTFLNLNFRGYLLDQRFMTFSLSGDYLGLNYGGETTLPNNRNFGYRARVDFFTERPFSFGFTYGRKELRFDQILAQTGEFKTHSFEKGAYVSLSRLKYLPSIKISYSQRQYFANVSSPNDEQVNLLLFSLNHTLGPSRLNLYYRNEDRRNQFFDLDRRGQNLRLIERINLGQSSYFLLTGYYNDYLTALTNGSSLRSRNGVLTFNLFHSFGRQGRWKLIHTISYNHIGQYLSRAYNFGTVLNLPLRRNLLLTPEAYCFINHLRQPEGRDRLIEPRAGFKLHWRQDSGGLRWTTMVGLFYRLQQTRSGGRSQDLSRYYSLGLETGRLEKLRLYLAYQYSGVENEPGRSSQDFSLFFISLGLKQKSHLARFELRSRALHFLEIYFYSRFNSFRQDYAFRGPTDSRTLNNGLTLDFGKISFTADYGFHRFYFGNTRAEYKSFFLHLNARLFRNFSLRAQSTRRERQDIFFRGDYELLNEAFLEYRLGRITLQVAYRRLVGRLAGLLRQDEVFFIRISRSFQSLF